jgi:hypothetical protein
MSVKAFDQFAFAAPSPWGEARNVECIIDVAHYCNQFHEELRDDIKQAFGMAVYRVGIVYEYADLILGSSGLVLSAYEGVNKIGASVPEALDRLCQGVVPELVEMRTEFDGKWDRATAINACNWLLASGGALSESGLSAVQIEQCWRAIEHVREQLEGELPPRALRSADLGEMLLAFPWSPHLQLVRRVAALYFYYLNEA